MMKRGICLLAALTLILGVCVNTPLVSGAAPITEENIKTKSCSLTVHPAGGNDASEKFKQDVESAGVVVDIYKVADIVKTPGYDSYSYELLTGYESMEELLGAEKVTDENWRDLAQMAAKTALDPETKENGQVVFGGETYSTVKLNYVKHENLETGLYLIVARGADLTALEDYRITIESTKEEKDPDSGEVKTEKVERIATIANSKEYTYVFAPQLISIPMKGTAEVKEPKKPQEDYMTSDTGDWIYDLNVYLKPQRVERYGSLRIIKNLQDFAVVAGQQLKPVTFVFEITWTAVEGDPPQKVQHRRVESLTFTGAGEQEIIVERIPAGMDVTVTEVYSGAGYEIVGDRSHTVTIEADEIKNGVAVVKKNGEVEEIAYIRNGEPGTGNTGGQNPAANIKSASFENRYGGEQKQGSGIKNQFIFENGKWEWYSDPPQNANGNKGLPPKAGASSGTAVGQEAD